MDIHPHPANKLGGYPSTYAYPKPFRILVLLFSSSFLPLIHLLSVATTVMFFFLVVAFALLPGAPAVLWAGPDATPTYKPHPQYEGWSPAITGLVGVIGKPYELFKRQSFATCGYISAISCKLHTIFARDATNSTPALSIICSDPNDICVTETLLGAVGCCPVTSTDCVIATSCVPYISQEYCDAACQADDFIAKCDTVEPYCIDYIYVYPATELTYHGCATLAYVETVCPTYSDSAVTTTFTSSQSSPTSSVLSSSSSSSNTPTSPPTAVSATAVYATTAPAAIAGGVVGGMAVLAALGFGIFYVLARRRHESASLAGLLGSDLTLARLDLVHIKPSQAKPQAG